MVSSDEVVTARGAPDWHAVKGEPDWVYNCYLASIWPHFVRGTFDLHKLQSEEMRFTNDTRH